MEPKLKHKTTIVIDPTQNLGIQIKRSQRRNKTMLRTYKTNKNQNSSQYYTNQKQIKSIVEGKIQELHKKMKEFFTSQRKTHLQQIAPDMQSLKKLICQLKEQLSKPKSMEEIERQKHELLKRKARILQEIEKINKELKGNKKELLQLKMESDEVERQVNNALATLRKYRHQMDKKKIASQSIQGTLQITDDKKNNSNVYKVLNDSLLEQNHPTQTQQTENLRVSFEVGDAKQNCNQNDHIHITEVLQREDSKYKLPSIKSNSALIKTDSKLSNIKNKFIELQSCRNSRLKKKPHNILGLNTPGMNNSTSFETILNPLDTISHSNLSYSNLYGQFRPKIKKSMPFDLSLEIQRYQQLVNKEKWAEVQKLFGQVNDLDAEIKQKTTNGIKSTIKSSSSVNILSQLLMDELRKVQFASYKQKGYHQGLKDKHTKQKLNQKTYSKIFHLMSSSQKL